MLLVILSVTFAASTTSIARRNTRSYSLFEDANYPQKLHTQVSKGLSNQYRFLKGSIVQVFILNIMFQMCTWTSGTSKEKYSVDLGILSEEQEHFL